jgi:hypothetical protein
MTTQDTINSVERLVNKGQTVPSNLIKALVATCKMLQSIAEQQSKKITQLEAAVKKANAERAEVQS